MMATFKDGRFSCDVHGDLGEHDEAIEKQTVLYSGEDQIDGFLCMDCLGEDVAASEAPGQKPRTHFLPTINQPGLFEPMSAETQAEMYYCKYCGNYHPVAAKEYYCPLDPHR